MVSLPARLYYGQGNGHEGISECGFLAAEVPRFGPSRCRRQYFEGKEGEAQEILAEPPEVPAPTCTTRGTGWGHVTIWEAEGGVRRDGSKAAAVERMDLRRDVATNCSLSDAPPRRPPVPNGGASATPPNWSCSSQRSEGSNHTRRREHRRQACGWQRPGSFPSPQGVVSGSLGDAILTVLPHDGMSDFGASQLVCTETVPRGPPPTASHSSRN